jgi:hypothetical protein
MSKLVPHTDKEIKAYLKEHTTWGTSIYGREIILNLDGHKKTCSGCDNRKTLKEWAYNEVKEYFATRLETK